VPHPRWGYDRAPCVATRAGAGRWARVVAQRCGSRIDRVRTAAWGNQTATGQNGSAIVDYQIYGYTGGITDPIDGLLHLGHRWYDSHNGRFTQRDDITTLANPSRANRYQYAASNPTSYVDPTGQDACQVAALLAGVFGTAAGAVGLWSLFADSTIIGLPAGLVLGGVSGVLWVVAWIYTIEAAITC
jgi:RHS repeat-associated protein